MREADLAILVRSFAPVIQKFVADATAPLHARIAELEARPRFERGYVRDDGVLILRLSDGSESDAGDVRGPKGAAGRDGADVDMDAVREHATREVRALFDAMPKPKDGAKGEPGKDGADVVNGVIDRRGHLLITLSNGVTKDCGRVVGKNGKDGEKGDRGEAGAPGRDANIEAISALKGDPGEPGKDGKSVDPAEVDRIISEKLAEIVSKYPAPRDGKDGKDADMSVLRSELETMVAALPKPEKGEKGDPGKDGVSVVDSIIDKDGVLALSFSNGEVRKAGVVVGEKGEPGRDGLGFDDFRLDYDGERTLSFVYERGDARREKSFDLPIPIYREVFTEGTAYKRGDSVTMGGSLFTATRDTTDRPGQEGSGWRMSVKRGRDGKDGLNGKPGEKGEKGDRGRDLTQVDPNTREKW